MNNTATATNTNIITFPGTLSNRQLDNRIKKISALNEQVDALTKEIDAIKAEIKESMKDLAEVNTGKYIIRNTPVESRRIDSKALKAEFPDIYNEFSKLVKSTRFSFKEA